MPHDAHQTDRLRTLRRRAETIVRQRAAELPDGVRPDVERLVHELEVYHTELEMQNEELRAAQRELEASRDRYVDLYDFAPVGYVTVSERGEIRQLNLTAAKMLGVERARLIGRRLPGFAAKGHKAPLLQHLRDCIAGRGPASYELLLAPPGRQPLPVKLDAVRGEEGEETLLRLSLTDISQLKQAEEEIRSLALFPQQSPNPVLRIARDGTLLHDNPASGPLLRCWNVRRGERVPRDLRRRASALLAADRGEEMECDCDGLIYSCLLSPVADQGYVNVYGRDVTDRRRAEEAVRESHRFLQAVLDSLPAQVAVLDRQGTVIDVNEPWLQFARENGARHVAGVGADYLAECRRAMQTDDPLARQALEGIQAVLDGTLETFTLEYPCHAPGEERWFLMQVTPVRYEGGGAVVAHSDITRRKLAEDALRASEERFRSLAEAMPQLVWTAAADGAVDYYNSRAAQYKGLRRTAEGRWTWQPVLHPDDFSATLTAWHAALADMRPYQAEHRVRMADESYRWHLSRAVPIRHDDRLQWFGTATDIHEIKLAEEALRESEERFQLAAEAARFGTYDADLTAGTLYWSPEMREIVGVPADAPTPPPGVVPDFIHPDDAPQVEEMLREAFNPLGDGTVFAEHRIIRPDGSVHWIQLRGRVQFTNEGGERRAVRSTGMILDITQRRRAEETLRRLNEKLERRVQERTRELAAAEAQYRGLVENTLDIPFSVTASGKIRYIGPQVKRYGFDSAELAGQAFLKFVHPSDRERVRADFRRTMQEGEAVPSVFRIPTPDGNLVWLEQRAAAQRDAAGAVVAVAGVIRDVTERKTLEETVAQIAAQERRRFGHDLHDGLGQELTGLGYLATLLRKQLEAAGAPQADMARQLTEGLQQAIDSTKNVARGMAPVDPEPGGLAAALERLAGNIGSYYGTRCRCRCRGKVEIADAAVAGELFRIAQEAVTNAARHAQATRIDIELNSQADGIALAVRDNGLGLPDDFGRAPGMGLRIMRYRAEMIGAALSIRSGSGGGTVVTCILPHGV